MKKWKSLSVTIHARPFQLEEAHESLAALLNEHQINPQEVVVASTTSRPSGSAGYSFTTIHFLVYTESDVKKGLKIDFEPEASKEMQRQSRK